MVIEISLKNPHFLESERGGSGGFLSQSSVLLATQEHFISFGTTIYLTIALCYPATSELLEQLLSGTKLFSFIHSTSG